MLPPVLTSPLASCWRGRESPFCLCRALPVPAHVYAEPWKGGGVVVQAEHSAWFDTCLVVTKTNTSKLEQSQSTRPSESAQRIDLIANVVQSAESIRYHWHHQWHHRTTHRTHLTTHSTPTAPATATAASLHNAFRGRQTCSYKHVYKHLRLANAR